MNILCVCTYNQTRSVLMAALLTEHLRAEGVRAAVASAGTRAGGGLPLPTTIDLLARRGIDLSSPAKFALGLALAGAGARLAIHHAGTE